MKVAKRLAPKPIEQELSSGVPLFLDQLVETPRKPPYSMAETMVRGATAHGGALLGLPVMALAS